MCAGWECKSGMSDCGGATAHCILDRKICDGVVDCPGGEDEEGLTTSDGLDIQCGLVGGHCRLYHALYPAANYTAGSLCRGGVCVARRSWCDGVCDCAECEDEESCQEWDCGERRFKCRVSNICLHQARVCDGVYDCGAGDRSDEHDCPCQEDEEEDVGGGRGVPHSLSWLVRKSGKTCIKDKTCFKIKNLRINLDRQD